ncbi:MAG TPA: hypothetical protein VEW45_00455 [Candidatus Dormibacteraeota bacterium]|nr:hypothetical protein [Candidatus Dormibacteraeota bacterium]
MQARHLVGALALALSGCISPSVSLAPTSSGHSAHDPLAEEVKTGLADAFAMSFEPAGPHHELGTAPDGVQLDLVGVPVEEVVLSLPSEDRSAAVETGLAYLPHLRQLLDGPDAVWDWTAEALACREDLGADCEMSFAQGNLTAHFTDGGEDFLVLVITREE